MSLLKQSALGSLWVFLGQFAGYGASFVRNMILARVLSKADFGIAASMGMMMALLEVSSKMGINRLIVQSKKGGETLFIQTSHTINVAASLVSALVLVIGSPALGQMLNIPRPLWIGIWLAVITIIRGFENLALSKLERNMQFGPAVLVEVLPQIAITLIAYPLANKLGDYSAVLYLLLIKGVTGCVLTHLLAGVPFRLGFHLDFAKQILRMAWPLVVSTFLVYGILQGEQIIVVSVFDPETLAPYVAAASLVAIPTFIIGRVINTVFLPILAKSVEHADLFSERLGLCFNLAGLFAASSATAMVVGGETLIVWIYGDKYANTGLLFGVLASAGAFRTFRLSISVASLAKGDSRADMLSNAFRILSLVPAAVLALRQASLESIAATGLLGECMACGYGIYRISGRDNVASKAMVGPVLLIGTELLIAFFISHAVVGRSHFMIGLACGLCIPVLAAAPFFALGDMPRRCGQLIRIYRKGV